MHKNLSIYLRKPLQLKLQVKRITNVTQNYKCAYMTSINIVTQHKNIQLKSKEILFTHSQ